jgi:hypothetical protein
MIPPFENANQSENAQKTIVVIGNGMVGHRFCERLIEYDRERQFRVVTFCEEPRAAYDRVGLTSFFASRSTSAIGRTASIASAASSRRTRGFRLLTIMS